MRVALEQLDTRGVVLELPVGQDGVRQSVALRSAQKLRGTLEQEAGRLTLSGLAAEEILCETIGLLFGQVRLTEGELRAHGLFAELDVAEGHTSLDAAAATIVAGGSAVDAGAFHVDGQVRLDQLKLEVRDGKGHLEFGEIEVKGFSLRAGPIGVEAQSVVAKNLRIGWGNGLELSAESLSAAGARLSVAGHGELRSRAFTARDASWRAGRARVGAVSLGEAQVAANLPELPASSAASAAAHKERLAALLRSAKLDAYLGIFDALFGHVDVDVQVDVSLPVIGSRRAVHEMRIPIEAGSVDYRKLESNLATLEDSLLDFAVRDGALGLELGIPLLPTRGRGKQLVVWDLNEADLALAEQNRVRLAVLPKAQLAVDLPTSLPGSSADQGDQGKSPLALRHVGLANIDVNLGIAPTEPKPTVALKSLRLDGLKLHGTVHHDVEGPPRHGELNGGLVGLTARVAELPLGPDRLSVGAFQVERLSDVHVDFVGPRPTRVNAALTGLSLEELVLVHPTKAA